MRMKDFQCAACGLMLEELVDNDVNSWDCPACAGEMQHVWTAAPKLCTEVIPSYPGCKGQKAGYVHSHGARDASKIQSGYGGSQGPK